MHFLRLIFSSFVFGAITPFGILAQFHQDLHHRQYHSVSADARQLSGFARSGVAPLTTEEIARVENDLADYRAKNGGGYAQTSNGGSININVYVHVIHRSDGVGSVSDQMIANQIKVLNDGFGGVASSYPKCGGGSQPAGLKTPFKFELVQTTRTANNDLFADDNYMRTVNFMQTKRVGTCSDLNIIIKNHNSFLGTGAYPSNCNKNKLGYDYVFIKYDTLPGGSFATANEGDNAIHQVGHWLGLSNTFDNGCSSPGDNVDDTPYEASAASGCPIGRDTCPGNAGNDPIGNFMDFTDDCCMNTFSSGQITRMVDQAALYRNLLPSPFDITGFLPAQQPYRSSNRAYNFIFQEDGNLVLYGPSGPMWWTGTHGNGDTCVMQSDGNLVIYNNGKDIWHSSTMGNPGAKLQVTNTGSVIIADKNDNIIKTYGIEKITGVLTTHTSFKKLYALVCQQDGNLVLYGPSGPSWATGTHGNGETCAMEPDGNLVIRKSGTAMWASGTGGNPGAYMTVFDTGFVVMYDKDGNILKVFGEGERISGTLPVDQPYISPNGLNHLVFQSDGILAAYRSGVLTWSSGTKGNGATCSMEPDGNLVIRNSGTPTWNSGTGGNPGAYGAMTDAGTFVIYDQSGGIIKSYGIEAITGVLAKDQKYFSPNKLHFFVHQAGGNLVLHNNGSVFWTTGTHGNGETCYMQPDGNMVIYKSGTAIWHSGTSGNPGAYLTIDDNGWLNIHDKFGTVLKRW